MKVIELNDRGIKVGDENGIIVQSPGFALVVDNEIQVGEAAEQQARLQPTNSFSKYWLELNLEPISHSPKVRHNADLAYAQLIHLAELGAIDDEVIFAVPGNFSRQQLAILLGLAQQCPFSAIGVVDSALATVSALARNEHLIYADIQLHQVVLTKLVIENDHLTSEGVVQIPGVGNQNFMNLMMQIATDMFIQQCRFNPQHNAESEQQLYNELPAWLLQDVTEKTLQLELKGASAVHTAKLPRETLIAALGEYYKKIHEQIEAMIGDANTQLILSKSLAELPGFQSTLKQISDYTATGEETNLHTHKYKDLIVPEDEAIHLVDKLSLSGLGLKTEDSAPTNNARKQPTHALFENRAIAVSNIDIRNNAEGNGNVNGKVNGSSPSRRTIVMNIANLPETLGKIEKRSDGVFLSSNGQEVYLNDAPISGEQVLNLGDRIRFDDSGDEIRLIQVSDGQ